MKLAIPLLIASLTLPVGAVGTSRPQGTAITLNTSGASPSTSGIVAAVRNTEVYIRSANNRLTPLHVPTGTRVVTSDGYRLAAADIQLGDRLSVRGRGEIVDLSQQVRQMTGIVSDVPDPSGDVVIVNARRVGPVVADIGREVAYSDSSHETSSSVQLQDADIVRLTGTFDGRIGEMTETLAIARLGPFPSPTPTR